MNRNTTSLSQHYKDYKKDNPHKRTIEEISQHFQECATVGDVEDVIYGGPNYHLVELIGDFTFDDYDEEGFEIKFRPDGEDETQVLEFKWKEVELQTYDLELRGEFIRRVQVKALSLHDAEELLDELLNKVSLVVDDFENEDVRTVGDLEITEVNIW